VSGVAVTAIAALLLGVPPKQTLTVSVSGSGRVTSQPAGIKCPSRCSVRVKKGAKVRLTASPSRGAAFSRWTAPCGRSRTCIVRVTRAKRVRAVFVAIPPPSAKAGHYTGTYTDGTRFDFDVQGSSMTNLVFDFNGHCSVGGNLAGPLTSVTGTFPVSPDGSVSGHIALSFPNATGTADFAGTLTSSGSGSGTLTIDLDLIDSTVTCTSTGTWTAQTS